MSPAIGVILALGIGGMAILSGLDGDRALNRSGIPGDSRA